MIYLSGKFSGDIVETCNEFRDIEKRFKNICFINPLSMNKGLNLVTTCETDNQIISITKTEHYNRSTAFSFDIHAVMACDHVYALNNWEKSCGALTEILVALNTGKKIIFQYKYWAVGGHSIFSKGKFLGILYDPSILRPSQQSEFRQLFIETVPNTKVSEKIWNSEHIKIIEISEYLDGLTN